MKYTNRMADNEVKNRNLGALLMLFVKNDDVISAKSLLASNDEQGRKMIVSTVHLEGHVPLCVAATRGNTTMVEFLVKGCRANTEERDFCFATPLWCAANRGMLEVVKLLRELGADINAVSKSRLTSVNNACCTKEIETVKFLVRQGADINRPDERGETCLMNSVQCLKLCQFLIDNGARVNEQNNIGNTALHRAIMEGRLKTVELLLDYGSDQNIKNNLGDDALQFASLHGAELIVKKLVARKNPTLSRLIESQQLLGSHCLLFSVAGDVRHALVYWRRSVTLRMANPCADSPEIEPPPAYLITKKVNTLEELEELCQDEEMVLIYALENLLRIVSPGHKKTIAGLVGVINVLASNEKYRRSFDLLRCAFRVLQARTQAWTDDHASLLDSLKWTCWTAVHRSQFKIEFHDVFEILDIVSSNAKFAKQEDDYDNSHCMELIFSFVCIFVEIDKNPDQMDSFKRVVHRLVRSQMKNWCGKTFLHYAIEQYCFYRDGLSVVEVFLECGADVNAVDRSYNTALHLCAQPYLNSLTQNEEEVIKLLRYSAHVDIVNDSGDIAAKGLPLMILDHVNLQCLAASVIRNRPIPYKGKIPASLELFVQMHGRCRR